jgi:Type II secretion system (T2SS), protein E, N-terminal domain
MSPSSGEHGGSKFLDSVYKTVLSQFHGEIAARINVEQMFILIDGVLPLEACLYYEVLPLYLDGQHIYLGMVCPDDSTASDYVRRIVSYHNYSSVSHPITAETLQAMLTAYLNYSGNKQNITPEQTQVIRSQLHRSARARADQSVDRNQQQTFIVDRPDDLLQDAMSGADAQTYAGPRSVPDLNDPMIEASAEVAPTAPLTPLPKPVVNRSASKSDEGQAPPSMVLPLLPELKIQAHLLASPVERLAELQPPELLQELLGRVLFGGIGRLYFERQAQSGRVLWSQNGVLQSVLERVDLAILEGLIQELKQMAGLPLTLIESAQQIELERIYNQARILLRFRFMPTASGEEATVQVLRGAALKFYQQQQLTNLERDALSIAKQLQIKLNEIRDRADARSGLARSRLESLPALSQLLHQIEAQVGILKSSLDSNDPLDDEA